MVKALLTQSQRATLRIAATNDVIKILRSEVNKEIGEFSANKAVYVGHPATVDALLRKGFIAHAVGYGMYEITDAGVEAVQRMSDEEA